MIPAERATLTLATDPRGGHVVVEAIAVHAYTCPFWRLGTRHGPCNCGATELWQTKLAQRVAERVLAL